MRCIAFIYVVTFYVWCLTKTENNDNINGGETLFPDIQSFKHMANIFLFHFAIFSFFFVCSLKNETSSPKPKRKKY